MGIGRPKGTKNTIYTPEFKLTVVEYLEKNGLNETLRHFFGHTPSAKIFTNRVYNWQRIYLQSGYEGLCEERRGKSSTQDGVYKGRTPKFHPKENEDLIAKVQRLEMENAYLKKLAALIQEEEKKQKRSK